MDIQNHDQNETHRYLVHFPAHPERRSDPHYKDFQAFRRRTHKTAKCAEAVRRGDFSECHGGLELHHTHIEFSLQNGVDLKLLERDYPGISDPTQIGAWVESGANLEWLCVAHHRGHGGVHSATASDFEASRYVRGLIS